MERRRKDSARLAWDSKPKRAPNPRDVEFQTAEVVVPNPQRDLDQLPLSFRDQLLGESELDKRAMNRLVWGDNLLAMQALLAQGYEGKIDLIYIDPPFDSGADYSHRVQAGADEVVKEPSVIERLAYKDTWTGGVDSYMDMIWPRLQLMHRLLSERGTIYVHCDWRLHHLLQLALEEVFGRESFLCEIIWKRSASKLKALSNRLLIVNDYILVFSKTSGYTYNVMYLPYSEEYKKRFTLKDEHGFYYWAPIGTYSQERLERLKQQGRVRIPENPHAMPRVKNYLHEGKGVPPDNVWADIDAINSQAKEDTGFDTQKPEALLERIIKTSSNEGDLVADFFAGSGTTCVVAEKLGRSWVGCDFGKTGLQIARTRLVEAEAKPFLLENIGNYQREMIYLHGGKVSEMQRVVLKLYDAVQRSDRPDIGVKLREDKTGRERTELVHVGYPDRPVTAKKVEEVLRAAERMDGIGYLRVVFLAWDYEPNFDQALEGRKKAAKDWPRVECEARMIPPDIYEYLKKAKDESEVEKLRDKVQFYEKPYMRLGEPTVKAVSGGQFEVSVRIERYVVFDFPVKDAADREKLRELAQNNFAVLMDYWAVDWDYDGFTFKSQQQEFRGFGKRAKTVSTLATTTLSGGKEREVAIRVVDIFGNDASAHVRIDLRGK